MISKESLILIAVLVVLVTGFMNWSEVKATEIQNSVDNQIKNVLTV